jgi:pimeloyl-ACP methyl ester carboxylesterase
MAIFGKIPILLLPGMDGPGELLAALADKLAAARAVQVISYPRNKPLRYDDLTRTVAERTPKDRFVILGESFSGPIAIEIAATDPRVAGLILASSFAWHPFPSICAPLGRMLVSRRTSAKLIEAVLLGSTGTPELRVQLRRQLKDLPQEIIRTRVTEALQVNKREQLRQITCPILCLQGRFDRLVGNHGLRQIMSVQPDCQVIWFEASHMLLETQPDTAAAAINVFCERLRVA